VPEIQGYNLALTVLCWLSGHNLVLTVLCLPFCPVDVAAACAVAREATEAGEEAATDMEHFQTF